jgi:UDP-3-O-[3-hydroxymyristoyl] glucosamine N-acyltransferase
MNFKAIIDYLNPLDFFLVNDNEINNVKSIYDLSFNSNSIGWCSDQNIEEIKNIKNGTILISEATFQIINNENIGIGLNKIIVEYPRLAFASILRNFFSKSIVYGKIHNSAVIETNISFDRNLVNIGPNVVIEENVTLGSNIQIGSNSVIKEGTVISDGVQIGSNCTIGGIGFGYEKNEHGNYELIPHLGNVVLKEFVDIGNNVCIDRAVLGCTLLEKGVKVDNLVHISHGVTIGSNSLIIAHAMIAGSVKIGENTWVAPCVSIRQKLKIGDNVTIGLGSVVLNDVQNGETVIGVPAKKMNK